MFFGGRNSSFGGCKILGLLDSYLGVGVWKKCDSCLTNCNFDRPHLGEKNAGSSSHFLGEGRSKISLHARYHINICHELSPMEFQNDEDTFCDENVILLATLTQKKPICHQIMLWVG